MPSFTGLVAYPITPLSDDGGLNLGALAQVVTAAAAAGIAGVTVLATSGAGVTFNRRERREVVEAAVAAAAAGSPGGKDAIPVYAAVSAAGTREVLDLARDAERAGAAGLVLTPFAYLPLSEHEVRALFGRVSDATELPLCFYNKPLQTHYDVSVETVAFLAAQTRVAAIKDTMRRDNVGLRLAQLRDAVGQDFSLGLSSDVHLLSDLPRVDAWHTGLAALLPGDYVSAWRAARQALPVGEGHARLLQLANTVSMMPHAIGAMHALARELGLVTAMPRGPFGAAGEQDVARLRQALGAMPGPAGGVRAADPLP